MTRNAAALVVGIDRYDDNGIPILSGSIHDGKIAVAWLRKIGVPVARIHLHASPCPALPADLDGVPILSARLDDILGSLDALSRDRGDQLFLFLSGHGLNVPGATGGAIFLARDYGSGLPNSLKNMRMQGYIQWMLSWQFRDQFLFYDACQNPSTSIGRVSLVKAIDPPMLDALPVTFTGGMLACFSASPGQTAWAGTGDGVLVRHVLEELDPDALAGMAPDAQQQDSVMYDWSTGSRRLDLRSLFGAIIAPAITEEAAKAGNAQTPICIPYGTATASPFSPILELPDEPTSDITVTLLPVEAAAAVKALRLSIQTPPRNAFLPDAGKELVNPLLCKGPVATEVRASCTPKEGSKWRTLDSPQTAILGDKPATITFTFYPTPPAGPPGPPDMYNIRVTGSDGSPSFPLGAAAYEQIAKTNALNADFEEGVSFTTHENGPDIGFDANIAGAHERAATVANDWLCAIRQHVADQAMSAILFPPGTDPEGKSPNIRFSLAEGGAVGLGGFLGDLKSVAVVAVGDNDPALILSLSEIEQHPVERVDPGPHRVTIDLPWGRWSRLIYPRDDGSQAHCALPPRIGREPLRNAWLRSAGGENLPSVDAQTGRRIATGLTAAIVTLGQIVDNDDRVEPFSRTTLPEWDVLFSAARLDVVSESRIRDLASDPPADLKAEERALLLLGLGHTALAQGFFGALRAALAPIDGIFRRSVDYALLSNSLLAEDRKRDAETQAANIRRHCDEQDRHLAPAIILHWSAPLLASLYMKVEASLPTWLTRLAPNSIIAVRTRADAHIEDHTGKHERATAKPAESHAVHERAPPSATELPAASDLSEVFRVLLRRRRDKDRRDDEPKGYA